MEKQKLILRNVFVKQHGHDPSELGLCYCEKTTNEMNEKEMRFIITEARNNFIS